MVQFPFGELMEDEKTIIAVNVTGTTTAGGAVAAGAILGSAPSHVRRIIGFRASIAFPGFRLKGGGVLLPKGSALADGYQQAPAAEYVPASLWITPNDPITFDVASAAASTAYVLTVYFTSANRDDGR